MSDPARICARQGGAVNLISQRLAPRLAALLLIALGGLHPAASAAGAGAFIYGDVDNSGTVEVLDALLTLRHGVGLAELGGPRRHAADVDGDSRVSAADAVLILRRIAGRGGPFPAEARLAAAEGAVGEAEGTLQQRDIAGACALVGSLPPIPPREALLSRLELVRAVREGPQGFWCYRFADSSTVEFRIRAPAQVRASHFELALDGAMAGGGAVDDPLRAAGIPPGADPSRLEVRFFAAAGAPVPLAAAGCAGPPGATFGALRLQDSWSVQPLHHGVSEFRVHSNIPGVSHCELSAGGELVGIRFAAGEGMCSIDLLFADPALLEVRLYGSAGAAEPIAVARCDGAAGAGFGRLVHSIQPPGAGP